MKTASFVFCGLMILLPMQASSAAIVGIDSTSTSPTLARGSTPDCEILDFTVSGTTSSDLVFFQANSINSLSQPFNGSGESWHPTAGSEADTLAMVSSKYITQGKANAGRLDYSIGKSLDVDDGTTFFMYELVLANQAGDDVSVIPLSGGSPVGNWSLAINPSDYGTQTPVFDINFIGNVGARGVTFTLADFTGDTGSLSGVDGLRFRDTGNDWDPIAAGMVNAAVVIPEPTTMWTFLAILLGLVAGIGRRRK